MSGCDVCRHESGGKEVGVAAVPSAPVSLMWCDRCLYENAFPRFVVETWLFADAPWETGEWDAMPEKPPSTYPLAEWTRSGTVWLDGAYVPIPDALERIWADEYGKWREDQGR